MKLSQSSRAKALIAALILSAVFSTQASEITVSVLVTPNQRAAYESLFKSFHEKTDIKVNIVLRADETYKQNIPKWLESGEIDVLYWQASQRLFKYAKLGLIHPITQIWKDNNLDKDFDHVKNGVSLGNKIYGLPVSYYHWGLYYNKSIIENYGEVPSNWKEFLVLCKKLKADKVTPIGIGTKHHWPAAAWFDYLNLRINGIEFHRDLLLGEVSFHSPKVKAVFTEWKKLVDANYFNKNHSSMDWDDVLPSLYRKRMGFILIGNFVYNKLLATQHENIGFMPFPKLGKMPNYEDAPLDVFMISSRSRNIKEAEEFITFMAEADVQSKHNKGLGYLPPNKSAEVTGNYFIQSGAQLLNAATDVANYFDRDTVPEFDQVATPVLADFISTGDVEDTIIKLENYRLSIFQK